MNAQDDNAETPPAPHRRRRSFLAVRREESPGDASPSAVGLEDVAPEDVASEDVASEDVASEDVAPEDVAPEDVAPEVVAPEPDIPPPAADEDDIPLLTEVVPSDEPEPEPSATFDDRLEELATQMAEAIGRQMAYELPTLIEATLLNAEEGLRTGITATMEAALRDFIARRKQLQLPLDEPGSE